MLRKAITTAAVLTFVAILATTASPARAAEFKFLADDLTLDYDYTGNVPGGEMYMEIRSTVNSWMRGYLEDTSTTPSTTLDGASFTAAGTTDLVLLFNFTQNSPNNWSATGTFSLMDTGGVVATADITTTAVLIDTGDNQYFKIRGILTPDTPPAILLDPTGGVPWTFVGTANYGVAGNGSDGVASQVSIATWSDYNDGTVLTTQFLIGSGWDLDSYLGGTVVNNSADRHESGGEASGTIVPVPPAVLLGFVGLCLAGWKLRKYA